MALSLLDTYNPDSSLSLQLDSTLPAFTLEPAKVDISADIEKLSNLNLSPELLSYASQQPDISIDFSSGFSSSSSLYSNMFGDVLQGVKLQGAKGLYTGALLKTIASAEDVFNSLAFWGLNRGNINLSASNNRQNYENQMNAIDNQVLYAKNQLMDKFNTLVASNTVNMAARNLKVSTGAVLEASKETAHDITTDFRTLESNANLTKIGLKAAQQQSDLAAKLQKSQQFTQLLSGATELGLMYATGGGTGESFGNLYKNYRRAKALEEGSSIVDAVY